MTRYTYQYLSFNSQQQDSIEAILALAESALSCAWHVVEHGDSDVLLVNLDTEQGAQDYQTIQQSHPAYRIIAVAENPLDTPSAAWFLTKKPSAPPSLKELATLLNEVALVLAEAALAPQANPSEEPITPQAQPDLPPITATDADAGTTTTEANALLASADNVDDQQPPPAASFSTSTAALAQEPASTATVTELQPSLPVAAAHYLFGILLLAKQDGGRRIIKLNAAPALYLAPTDNSYYFAGSEAELHRYCTAPRQELTETQITKAKFKKIIATNPMPAQGYESLLVYAILKASAGRLLAGHQAELSYKLKHLPDTDKEPLLAPYQHLAQALYKQPTSLYDLAEQLPTPMAKVFDFYNVCQVLGYLELTTAANPVSEPKQSVLGHFLKAFFSK